MTLAKKKTKKPATPSVPPPARVSRVVPDEDNVPDVLDADVIAQFVTQTAPTTEKKPNPAETPSEDTAAPPEEPKKEPKEKPKEASKEDPKNPKGPKKFPVLPNIDPDPALPVAEESSAPPKKKSMRNIPFFVPFAVAALLAVLPASLSNFFLANATQSAERTLRNRQFSALFPGQPAFTDVADIAVDDTAAVFRVPCGTVVVAGHTGYKGDTHMTIGFNDDGTVAGLDLLPADPLVADTVQSFKGNQPPFEETGNIAVRLLTRAVNDAAQKAKTLTIPHTEEQGESP